MHGLIREQDSLGANPGAKLLVRHLYTRSQCGKVVIASSRPSVLLPAVRKQWLALSRKVQREAASTLNSVRQFELRNIIVHMQSLRFTTEWPPDVPADVFIAAPQQLLDWAPECKTLYVTCDIQTEHLHMITSFMRPGSLVVICRLG